MQASRRDILAAAATGLGSIAFTSTCFGTHGQAEPPAGKRKTKGTYGPDIYISGPSTGSIVGRSFAAWGTFTTAYVDEKSKQKEDIGAVDIKCRFCNEAGTDLVTAVTADQDSGYWIANFYNISEAAVPNGAQHLKVKVEMTATGTTSPVYGDEVTELMMSGASDPTPGVIVTDPSPMFERTAPSKVKIGFAPAHKGKIFGKLGIKLVLGSYFCKGKLTGTRKGPETPNDMQWITHHVFDPTGDKGKIVTYVVNVCCEDSNAKLRVFSAARSNLLVDI